MSMREGLYGLKEPALPQKPKSRFRKFLNIVFAFCMVIFVSLMTLHMVGGNSAYLKKTVEKFLTESSGYPTKVGKLNAVSFYPLIGVDLQDVTMEGSKGDIIARFSHLNFSTSFWSASSGSSFYTVEVRDALVSPNVVAPGKIEVGLFNIDATDKKKPKLSFKGTYDNKPVTFTADLAIVPGILGAVYFTFADPSPFELRAGDIHAEGNILTDFTGRSADITNLSAGPKLYPVKMEIALMNEFTSTGLKGKLKASAGDVDYNFSFLKPDKKKHIAGSLKADRFEIDDLLKSGGLLDSEKAIRDFYRAGANSEERDFGYLNLEVTIETAHLLKGGVDLGAIDAKLITKGNALQFDVAKGSEKAVAALNDLVPALKRAALQ